MNLGSIIGACAGAVLGAIIWAVVADHTGYEIGWIAWGLGVLVGFGAKFCGGGRSGAALGSICAVLALIAIFGGKMLALERIIPQQIREQCMEEFTLDMYQELKADAKALEKLESSEEYPAFMVQHMFTTAEKPEDVTEEEVQDFEVYTIPTLKEINEGTLSFETWRKSRTDSEVAYIMSEISLAEEVVTNFHPVDILFALLGLASAYKIGAGQEEPAHA